MPTCQHTRTRLIAKDKDAEYLECLDCGALLEAEELAQSREKPAAESGGPADRKNFNESLSDA